MMPCRLRKVSTLEIDAHEMMGLRASLTTFMSYRVDNECRSLDSDSYLPALLDAGAELAAEHFLPAVRLPA
jgi:hypothetical protein